MQRCTVCGTKVPDDARFCNNCGHTLKPADINTVTVNPRKISSNGGPPRDNLATVSTHPLPDAGMKEQKQVAAATVDTPSIGTSRPPETPISEIPTSILLDSVAEEGKDTPLDDEFSASSPSSAEQPSLAEAKPQVTTPTSVTASVQSPSAPTPKRTARSTVRWLIVALLVLAAGAGAFFARSLFTGPVGKVTPTVATPPTALPLITPIASVSSGTPSAGRGSTADLTFSGAVSGHMTGVNVVTCGSEVSVAGGTQYHLALFGTVNRQQYAFAFNIYPYTSPKVYSTEVFSFFGPAGESSSIAQWRSNPALGVNVTMNIDGKSGMLSIGYRSSSDNSTARVTGSWVCG